MLKEMVDDYTQLRDYYRDANFWLLPAFKILISFRIRQACFRNRIPLINGLLALFERIVYGIEISKYTEIGAGVIFLHPVGVVIGTGSKIGKRTVFCGSNTVGSRWPSEGQPNIGEYVQIGCGARILGGVIIGNGAQIGANAVVISDVPENAIAVGLPAKFKG